MLLGSNWDNSSNCSSRATNCNNFSSNANANIRARGTSDTGVRPSAGTCAVAKPKHTEKDSSGLVAGAKVRGITKMKRHGNLFEKICDMDNLRLAFKRASKGKHWQRKVREVEENLDEHLQRIQTMLREHTFTTADYRQKYIYEPKKRLISILPFYPDRIIQHAVMLVLEPIWDSLMINESFACRKYKGQHRASSLCKKYAMKYEYCMQFDVSKFYPSIPHEPLKALLRKKLKDNDLLWLLDDIIDSGEGDVGVPIGNYLSQWFGNLYMNELDMYAKHGLRIKAYVRYCDDFLVFSDDKEELKAVGDKLEAFCREVLCMRLSRKNLFHTYQGVDFVGYRHFSCGKVLLRKRTAKRMRKRLERLLLRMESGRAYDRDKARSSVASADGWMSHANTYHFKEAVKMWRMKGILYA